MLWTLPLAIYGVTFFTCVQGDGLSAGVHCPHKQDAPPKYEYNEVPVPDMNTRTSLVFSVKACANAHVALSSSLDLESDMAEIVIGAGGDTYTDFRACKLGCYKVSRPGTLLSCNEYRRFWLSWESADLVLGTGSQVGANVFMESTDFSSLTVNHVSIAMWTGSDGAWLFDFPEQTDPSRCVTSSTVSVTTSAVTTQEATTSTAMSHDVTFSSTDDVISSSTSRPPETSQFEITSLSSESSQSTTISQSWETSQSTPPTTSATAAPPPGSATSSVSETPVSETPVSETPMSVTRSVPVTPSVSVTPATSNAFAGPKCTCVNNKAPTVSQHALAVKETQEAAARLQKELVLTSQTRAERRRYRSIPDDRWSVQALGWAGVAVLLVAALCVVLPDVITLCRYVTTLRSRAPPRHNGHGRRDKTGGDNDVTQKTTVPLKTVKKMAI